VADDVAVRRARGRLVGLSANDLQLCAGPPSRSGAGGGGLQYWAYDRSVATSEVAITTLVLGISAKRQAECTAVFELADGRVRRIAFPGAAGSQAAPYAACVPLIQECDAMVRGGAIGTAMPAPATQPPATQPPATQVPSGPVPDPTEGSSAPD
jgi:hypothetical protein